MKKLLSALKGIGYLCSAVLLFIPYCLAIFLFPEPEENWLAKIEEEEKKNS